MHTIIILIISLHIIMYVGEKFDVYKTGRCNDYRTDYVVVLCW